VSRDETAGRRNDPARDIDLGSALLGLEVPEHGEGFFERLDAALASETPQPKRLRSAQARGHAAPGRWYTSGGALLAAAAAMVVVVGAGASILTSPGTPGDKGGSHDVARTSTAADIGQLVAASYAQATSLSGVLVHRTVDPGRVAESSVTFTISSEGDFLTRSTDAGTTTVVSYVTDEATVTTVSQRADRPANVLVQRNVDPASPQARTAAMLLQRSIGSVTAAMLDSDVAATTITYDGRPAWRVEVPAVADSLGTNSPDSLEVTVDQQSRFPVQVVASAKGRTVYTDVLHNLVVNAPMSPNTFAASIPGGASLHETDEGFRRLPLSEAAAHAGYSPLVPSALPAGFELAEVAMAKTGQPSGPEGMNPAGTDVVSLVYRHGFDVLVVQTWRAGNLSWDDPLGMEGFVHTQNKVVLAQGALSGSTATVVASAPATPHLWLVHDGLVVLVAGDASADQLVSVANSLTR
jgi:hypothetical protein